MFACLGSLRIHTRTLCKLSQMFHHFLVFSLTRRLSGPFLAVLAWIVKTNLSCKHTRVELLTMDINEIWNYAPFVFAVLHGCGCWLFSKDFRRLPMDSLRLRCVCLVRVNELIPLRAALDFVIDYFFVYCWIQRFGCHRYMAEGVREWELIEFHSKRLLYSPHRVQSPETSPFIFAFQFSRYRWIFGEICSVSI